MMQSPKISIITVVYNDRGHIEETILSVLNQTYRHIEYVIVDGASSDGTLEVIRSFGDKIKLISEPDRGLYDAMNKGLHVSQGDYVWYLNSGDQLFSEDTVEKMVAGMEGFPDVIYGGTMVIGEGGKEVGDRRLKPPGNLSWRSFRQG
ncbi:MAG: glycosyltransferase, partial [Bacteroidales bacterium]|nr:glycosyltransferase [Bacteroidales bacterium]